MMSYRTQLAKIGIQPGTVVSYRQTFYSRPQRLSDAMRSMDWPREFHQATEKPGEIDEGWTEECQGVTWDGSHWIFSSNGSGAASDSFPVTVGHMPKALYVFNGTTNFSDDSIVQRVVIATVTPLSATGTTESKIPEPPGGGIYHIGHIIFFEGQFYIDHWNNVGGQVLVLKNDGGAWSFVKWIPLELVGGQRVSLVAINPWDRNFYTCFGGKSVSELYIHSPDGKYTGRVFKLDPQISDKCYVQGGAFSPNGHLYIASGKSDVTPYQYIYCYSALNGRQLSAIQVLSKDSNQELEGICYADIIRGGHRVQLHAVLLDNITAARDNVFFKSFAASDPDLV